MSNTDCLLSHLAPNIKHPISGAAKTFFKNKRSPLWLVPSKPPTYIVVVIEKRERQCHCFDGYQPLNLLLHTSDRADRAPATLNCCWTAPVSPVKDHPIISLPQLLPSLLPHSEHVSLSSKPELLSLCTFHFLTAFSSYSAASSVVAAVEVNILAKVQSNIWLGSDIFVSAATTTAAFFSRLSLSALSETLSPSFFFLSQFHF